jgi:hypothetical protein
MNVIIKFYRIFIALTLAILIVNCSTSREKVYFINDNKLYKQCFVMLTKCTKSEMREETRCRQYLTRSGGVGCDYYTENVNHCTKYEEYNNPNCNDFGGSLISANPIEYCDDYMKNESEDKPNIVVILNNRKYDCKSFLTQSYQRNDSSLSVYDTPLQ